MLKRSFDILAAALGLLVLCPVFAAAAVAVRLGSPGPVLFKQERIGLKGRPFPIYKFRSMVVDAPVQGPPITAGDDCRITKVGRVLRKTKLDELPQLFNVLKGEMSFVGPRPEVPKYVKLFRDDYEEILQVRPGITDLASIRYRDEAAILGQADDSERQYVEWILPEKIRLAKEYARRTSLWLDLYLIVQTLWVLIAPGARDYLTRFGESCTDCRLASAHDRAKSSSSSKHATSYTGADA